MVLLDGRAVCFENLLGYAKLQELLGRIIQQLNEQDLKIRGLEEDLKTQKEATPTSSPATLRTGGENAHGEGEPDCRPELDEATKSNVARESLGSSEKQTQPPPSPSKSERGDRGDEDADSYAESFESDGEADVTGMQEEPLKDLGQQGHDEAADSDSYAESFESEERSPAGKEKGLLNESVQRAAKQKVSGAEGEASCVHGGLSANFAGKSTAATAGATVQRKASAVATTAIDSTDRLFALAPMVAKSRPVDISKDVLSREPPDKLAAGGEDASAWMLPGGAAEGTTGLCSLGRITPLASIPPVVAPAVAPAKLQRVLNEEKAPASGEDADRPGTAESKDATTEEKNPAQAIECHTTADVSNTEEKTKASPRPTAGAAAERNDLACGSVSAAAARVEPSTIDTKERSANSDTEKVATEAPASGNVAQAKAEPDQADLSATSDSPGATKDQQLDLIPKQADKSRSEVSAKAPESTRGASPQPPQSSASKATTAQDQAVATSLADKVAMAVDPPSSKADGKPGMQGSVAETSLRKDAARWMEEVRSTVLKDDRRQPEDPFGSDVPKRPHAFMPPRRREMAEQHVQAQPERRATSPPAGAARPLRDTLLGSFDRPLQADHRSLGSARSSESILPPPGDRKPAGRRSAWLTEDRDAAQEAGADATSSKSSSSSAKVENRVRDRDDRPHPVQGSLSAASSAPVEAAAAAAAAAPTQRPEPKEALEATRRRLGWLDETAADQSGNAPGRSSSSLQAAPAHGSNEAFLAKGRPPRSMVERSSAAAADDADASDSDDGDSFVSGVVSECLGDLTFDDSPHRHDC
eukprot:TRINITY_DN80763_c0_g1_i1.p1 TRINITY_DN80763_c0_g1~~TRINITY_DN80763_c0_g1_i1.p1  ORF type:complete len:817 (+),score=214.02 TRINITY_DN80763_c0_g1_i1:107-2557(+)